MKNLEEKNLYNPCWVMTYKGPYLKQLHKNAIVDKTYCGNGATTAALNEDYVIVAVPSIRDVENKLIKDDRITGLWADSKVIDDPSKWTTRIICTYEQVPSLVYKLDASKYWLVIDEAHNIYEQYLSRYEAIRNLIKVYKKFRATTLVSATLLPYEQLADKIGRFFPGFPIYKYYLQKCQPKKERDYKIVKTNNVIKYLEDKKGFFFVNSPTSIITMVNTLGLTKDNCEVIVGQSNINKVVKGIGWCNDFDKEWKDYNFITSTGFESIDIDVEPADCYVVFTNQEHSLKSEGMVMQAFHRLRRGCKSKTLVISNSFKYDKHQAINEYLNYIQQLKQIINQVDHFKNDLMIQLLKSCPEAIYVNGRWDIDLFYCQCKQDNINLLGDIVDMVADENIDYRPTRKNNETILLNARAKGYTGDTVKGAKAWLSGGFENALKNLNYEGIKLVKDIKADLKEISEAFGVKLCIKHLVPFYHMTSVRVGKNGDRGYEFTKKYFNYERVD